MKMKEIDNNKKMNNYDLFINKRNKLKKEVRDIEDILTLKNVKFSFKSISKDIDRIGLTELAIEGLMGFALGKIGNRFVKNKVLKKGVILASSYLVPIVMHKLTPFLKEKIKNKIQSLKIKSNKDILSDKNIIIEYDPEKN